MEDEWYAHTPPEHDPEKWHKLEDHLREVARMAGEFGEAFGAGDIARNAGQWHDAGKFSDAFQSYLRSCNEARIAGRKSPPSDAPHAIIGAAAAQDSITASVIACHHTGLQDFATIKRRLGPGAARSEARQDIDPVLSAARQALPDPSAQLPQWLAGLPEAERPYATEFLVRMVFSCVVDADALDTERHRDPQSAAQRAYESADWDELWTRFERAHAALAAASPDTSVNRIRRQVFEDCIAAAEMPQGVFRLQVPTGGGKTLSGLAFGMRHAMCHGLRRVILVIPYTSIIDQTADVYRNALGANVVLEHHSAVDLAEADDEGQTDNALRRRLAAENWDRPVVVTTTVQFFESLLANKGSRCRKLHNIAGSVVILDEVQTLPPALRDPLVAVLHELVERHRVSVVLCTATQPALEAGGHSAIGLRDVREIVPTYATHFEALRRVSYEVIPDPLPWADIAVRLRDHKQAIVVVNTRRDALALLDELASAPGLRHLSTLLCGAHRRDVLRRARQSLETGAPMLLVSTQVIECGVDLDAPVVFRAIAPLDRIAQAAGRCNREGRLAQPGRVVIFTPADGGAPRGAYRTGMDEAVGLLRDPSNDLHDPHLFERFFEILYTDLDTDVHRIQAMRKGLQYEGVARAARLISDDTTPVVVPYDPGAVEPAVAQARATGTVSAASWRTLQPFTVNLYRHDFMKAQGVGDVASVADGLHLWQGVYDDLRGIAGRMRDPGDLIQYRRDTTRASSRKEDT